VNLPARLLALFALLFISTRGLLGVECRRHDAPAPAGQPSHGGHGSHGMAETPSPDDEAPEACTCLDHCTACPSAAVLRASGDGFTPAAVGSFVGDAPVLTSHAPAALDHQLPWANAPPSTV